MKPVTAVLLISVGLALSGCSADAAEERPAAGSRPVGEPSSVPGAVRGSVMGVSPFLPEPTPFAWPAPPHPLATRAPTGNALGRVSGAALCRKWSRLLGQGTGQDESPMAARDVFDAHTRVAPGELELASRIMIQRLAMNRGHGAPELAGTMFLLSYDRLADACRAAGAPLVPARPLS